MVVRRNMYPKKDNVNRQRNGKKTTKDKIFNLREEKIVKKEKERNCLFVTFGNMPHDIDRFSRNASLAFVYESDCDIRPCGCVHGRLYVRRNLAVHLFGSHLPFIIVTKSKTSATMYRAAMRPLLQFRTNNGLAFLESTYFLPSFRYL